MRRLILCVLALVPAALAQGSGARPTAEELDAAQPAVVRAMTERILQACGGDVPRAAAEVLMAALENEDHATRYLLWQEAVGLAERGGEAWLARSHLQAMAHEFGGALVDQEIALFRRMASNATDATRLACVAMAAMYVAREHVATDERLCDRFYDVALRAALRTDDAPLYTYVQDYLVSLRAPRQLAAELEHTLPAAPWAPIDVATALLLGGLYQLEPYRLRDLAPLFGGVDALGDLDPMRAARELSGEELAALAGRARDAQRRAGCLRLARARLLRDYASGDEERRRELFAPLVTITEQLATSDGVTRLRFRADADREQLCYANGDWRVEQGRLLGTAQGANNFATHRVRFAGISSAVIRGGIATDAGQNFRCKFGTANLLLNWEVEPQNHLWIRGACHRCEPPAMTAGERHTVLLLQDGHQVHVAIDGRHLFTAPCLMAGTVSVYPALGSEVFVEEILVDGAPDGLVDAPIGPMM